jgi:hypothetical protein
MERMFKVDEDEWERVQISMDTFVLEFGNLYTLYLPAQSSHSEDPLSETLGLLRMVNKNKDVALS